MQNNVTELTQKLLRSVDNNYNVIDMPVVMEIITVLERMQITSELLEATRLGKHINELRRKATTESLQKRTKELVKRWRRLLFPGSNGNITSSTPVKTEDVNLNQVRKRQGDKLDPGGAKRPRVNGTSELDFSDNSNSSFKECVKSEPDRIILINSDSNSSFHDAKNDPILEMQQPKKRGRKKGTKNNRLLDEAETSFTNKMAVSRGNQKVKTTQELVASLQNRVSTPNASASGSNQRPLDNLSERAAKLTERVSIIDQKLNTNANRKNAQKKLVTKNSFTEVKNDRVIESGMVVNITNDRTVSTGDDEIIVVDDPDTQQDAQAVKQEAANDTNQAVTEPELLPKSYSIEEALSLLPPIDRSCLEEAPEDSEPTCTCILKEKKSLFSLEEEEDEAEAQIHFIEDCDCEARKYLAGKYRLDAADASSFNNAYLPGINGHFGLGAEERAPAMTEDGLFENIVPNIASERLAKQCDAEDFLGENYKRYSISDGGPPPQSEPPQPETFREFHEVLERPSFNDEPFRILPYVIID